MAGGGKGGKQTTQVQIPAWLEAGARQNMARADQIAQIGPVIERGPTVAAFSEPQQQAFQNTGVAASAFGLAPQGADMRYQPAPTTYAGGVQGYSSAPLYDQMLNDFRAASPGQFDFMRGMFIDPVTGAGPTNAPFAGRPSAPAPVAATSVIRRGGGGEGRSEDERMSRSTTSGGGYRGVRDMFDGGGPGKSGGRFSGGGRLSDAANRVTGR